MTAKGTADYTRTVMVRTSLGLMEVDVPTVETRFTGTFRDPTTDVPGLVMTDDGIVYLVLPDGTRVQLTGGGGGSQTLAQVLTLGNDGGGIRIENIDVPVGEFDAATKGYVDSQLGAGLLFVQPDDPGAVGAGAIWIQTGGSGRPALWVRNNDDDGWNVGLFTPDGGADDITILTGDETIQNAGAVRLVGGASGSGAGGTIQLIPGASDSGGDGQVQIFNGAGDLAVLVGDLVTLFGTTTIMPQSDTQALDLIGVPGQTQSLLRVLDSDLNEIMQITALGTVVSAPNGAVAAFSVGASDAIAALEGNALPITNIANGSADQDAVTVLQLNQALAPYSMGATEAAIAALAADNVFAPLTWTGDAGGLLDLTDPLLPIVVETGVYALTMVLRHDSDVAASDSATLGFRLTAGAVGTLPVPSILTKDPRFGTVYIPVNFTLFLAASSAIKIEANNNDPNLQAQAITCEIGRLVKIR